MKFSIDTDQKQIIVFDSISFKEIEELKKFIGESWEEYKISVEPRTITIKEEKWVPYYPTYPTTPYIPIQPYYGPITQPYPYPTLPYFQPSTGDPMPQQIPTWCVMDGKFYLECNSKEQAGFDFSTIASSASTLKDNCGFLQAVVIN